MRTSFVVGFLFNGHGEVALIKKNRPNWQRGKLNGIGGAVLEMESPHSAMCREFNEEAGLYHEGWKALCLLEYPSTSVNLYIFSLHLQGRPAIKTMTDEEVGWYPVKRLPDNLVNNVAWLVPYALDNERYRLHPYGRM